MGWFTKQVKNGRKIPWFRSYNHKIFSFSKRNLTDLSILRCNKLSTNISSGWLAFYDLGTKKSFKKLGKFMALVTFEVTNWWSTLIQQHYQLRKFPLKNVEYSIQICPMNVLNLVWFQLFFYFYLISDIHTCWVKNSCITNSFVSKIEHSFKSIVLKKEKKTSFIFTCNTHLHHGCAK